MAIELCAGGEPVVVVRSAARQSDDLVRTIDALRWMLDPDGGLIVRAGPGLGQGPGPDHRPLPDHDDLLPMYGRWATRAGAGSSRFFFAATRSTAGRAAARATLAGRLDPDGGCGWTAHLTYAVATGTEEQVVEIVVPLVPGTTCERHPTIGGIRVPACYRIVLSGEADGVPFREVPATLSVLPPARVGGQVPIEVLIGPVEVLTCGDLSWITTSVPLEDPDTVRFTASVADGDLRFGLLAPAGTLAVTWSGPGAAAGSASRLADLAVAPLRSTHASLRLHFGGDRVTGSVEATGVRHGGTAGYAATISGTLAQQQ